MLSQPRRTAVSTAVLALALALAGCQPATTTPAPVPSYRCTPEAGGAEFDCSQHQYDDMVAKDQLYAEAEAVYRKFLAEDLRIARAGGLSQPTSVLLATTDGVFFDDVMVGYRSDKKAGLTARGGDRVIERIDRVPGTSKGGSLATLRVCVDSSSIEVLRRGEPIGFGLVSQDDLYFAMRGQRLKIIGADGKEVRSCES